MLVKFCVIICRPDLLCRENVDFYTLFRVNSVAMKVTAGHLYILKCLIKLSQHDRAVQHSLFFLLTAV